MTRDERLRFGSWFAVRKDYLREAGITDNQIRRQFTLVGNENSVTGNAPVLVTYREDRDWFYLPRNSPAVSVRTREKAVDCTVWDGVDRDFGSPIALRPEQEAVVDSFVKSLSTPVGQFGGQIVAAAGSGKTVMALEVARRLGKAAVVLVHKEFFIDQWADRISTFLPKARVGYIQQSRAEYGPDYDICIAMIQSLVSRSYPDELFQSFGLVISDECHRLGAETWSQSITMFPARVRLGLTATPRRKDGLEKAFFWHIGPILSTVDREDTQVLTPEVYPVRSEFRVPASATVTRSGTFNMGRWITELAKNEGRNKLILGLILKALQAGRKVMLLTDRLDQLNILQEMLVGVTREYTYSQYIGGLSDSQREEAAKAQYIGATFKMAEEGLDIPSLDTLILATPKSDVEQAVGRIQRPCAGKKNPVVLDVVDVGYSIAIAMHQNRRKVYSRIGAKVHGMASV
jgi:superfamily II DNA or RNA helicase